MSTFDDTAAITVGFGKPYEVAIYLTTIQIPNLTNVSTTMFHMWRTARAVCYWS
jgi:hypothetical protein